MTIILTSLMSSLCWKFIPLIANFCPSVDATILTKHGHSIGKVLQCSEVVHIKVLNSYYNKQMTLTSDYGVFLYPVTGNAFHHEYSYTVILKTLSQN